MTNFEEKLIEGINDAIHDYMKPNVADLSLWNVTNHFKEIREADKQNLYTAMCQNIYSGLTDKSKSEVIDRALAEDNSGELLRTIDKDTDVPFEKYEAMFKILLQIEAKEALTIDRNKNPYLAGRNYASSSIGSLQEISRYDQHLETQKGETFELGFSSPDQYKALISELNNYVYGLRQELMDEIENDPKLANAVAKDFLSRLCDKAEEAISSRPLDLSTVLYDSYETRISEAVIIKSAFIDAANNPNSPTIVTKTDCLKLIGQYIKEVEKDLEYETVEYTTLKNAVKVLGQKTPKQQPVQKQNEIVDFDMSER